MIPRSGGEKVYLEAVYRRPKLLITVIFAAQAVALGFTGESLVHLCHSSSLTSGSFRMHCLCFLRGHRGKSQSNRMGRTCNCHRRRWIYHAAARLFATLWCSQHERYWRDQNCNSCLHCSNWLGYLGRRCCQRSRPVHELSPSVRCIGYIEQPVFGRVVQSDGIICRVCRQRSTEALM